MNVILSPWSHHIRSEMKKLSILSSMLSSSNVIPPPTTCQIEDIDENIDETSIVTFPPTTCEMNENTEKEIKCPWMFPSFIDEFGSFCAFPPEDDEDSFPSSWIFVDVVVMQCNIQPPARLAVCKKMCFLHDDPFI